MWIASGNGIMRMFKKILISLILSTIGTVFFAQSNNFFSEEKYYMAQDFEILKSEKREKYLEFFPEEYENPDDPIFDSDFADYDESYHNFYHYWYEYVPNKRLSVIKNTYEEMSMDKQRYSSIVWDKEKDLIMTIYCSPYIFVLGDYEIKENEIEFDLWSLAKDNLAYIHAISINKEINFSKDDSDRHSVKFVFDGDYLDFYIDNMIIHKFSRINNSSLKEYENLMLNNECDLSKVKWPRHADGTSDYDDKIIMPEPNKLIEDIQKTFPKKIEEASVPIEEVQPEKIVKYITKKEVRTIAVLSDFLTNPPPKGFLMTKINVGSKVKITKIGKKDTIDNIESNWVKIKIMPGATKGINKNPIPEGLEGWIFGGYLE